MFFACKNRATRNSCGQAELRLHNTRDTGLWTGFNQLKTQEIKAHEFN
jgi:hypothetical protein